MRGCVGLPFLSRYLGNVISSRRAESCIPPCHIWEKRFDGRISVRQHICYTHGEMLFTFGICSVAELLLQMQFLDDCCYTACGQRAVLLHDCNGASHMAESYGNKAKAQTATSRSKPKISNGASNSTSKSGRVLSTHMLCLNGLPQQLLCIGLLRGRLIKKLC